MMNTSLEEMLIFLMNNTEAHKNIDKFLEYGVDYEAAVKLVYTYEINKK